MSRSNKTRQFAEWPLTQEADDERDRIRDQQRRAVCGLTGPDLAIDAILWSLLNTHSFVTMDQVCCWDSARAEAAIDRAGLVRISRSSAFTTTEATATWFEETWNAIRAARPTAPVEGFAAWDNEQVDAERAYILGGTRVQDTDRAPSDSSRPPHLGERP